MKRLLTAFGAFGFKYGNALIPLIIIFCFALAIPPHRVFGSKHIENAKDFVSLAIALTGLGLRFLTFALMPAREGNGAVPLSLPARGGAMSQICRNPLYLGNIIICCGLFLMHGKLSVMILGSVAVIAFYNAVVHAEESFLLGRFGSDYLAYCERVPRWFPSREALLNVVRDNPLRWWSALRRDFPVIALSAAALAATEMYEKIGRPGRLKFNTGADILIGLIALICVALAIIVIRRTRPPRLPGR